MTKRTVMNSTAQSGFDLPFKEQEFNLLRYFAIYSIAFILAMTAILSFVIVVRQKQTMINHSVHMVEESTQHLNQNIMRENTLSIEEKNGHKNISRKNINYEELDKIVKDFMRSYADIVKINLFDRQGYTLYSSQKDNEGNMNTSNHIMEALNNRTVSEFVEKSDDKKNDPTEQDKFHKLDLLEVYVPIIVGNSQNGYDLHNKEAVVGVFEIYRDMGPMIHDIEVESFKMSFLVLVFMALLYIFLQLILRKANVIISRQNEEIERNNMNLEEAHKRIKHAMNEVIQHESFHVRYSGSDLLKCWEFKKCKQTKCPSYESPNLRCWQVAGTFCGGEIQGVFAKKFGDCRKCEVYNYAFKNKINNIGESFNNMMALLQNKHLELKGLNKTLKEVVNIDHLMQVGNRRYFQERVESLHQLALRYQHYYSIIICDVDYFKKYNDTYGHQMGDQVLISVANLFKKLLRKTDEIFRWGGEEIIIILPEQAMTDALKVAETLRAGIESLSIRHEQSASGVVTVSCGVSTFFPGKNNDVTWEHIIKKADDALYRAKEGSRNTVYSS